MIAVAMKNIEKYYGVHKVLNDITFEINEGEKVALVGRNGCGKSTIMKLASGQEKPDGGMLTFRKGIRAGYLEQTADGYEGSSVIDVLMSGRQEVVELKEEMEQLERLMSVEKDAGAQTRQITRYGQLSERFEQLDGYSLEEQVDTVSRGLLIDKAMYGKTFDNLSGGEKTRILFARMLITHPELLLLDEPTNHLDIKAVEWLEDFIRGYKGTVLMVSHDRYFLDKAAARIIEVEDGISEEYNGNYSYYVAEKERRLMVEFENYQDQQKKIRHMEEAIKRLRDWGARGDNEKFFIKARSMQKALDRMEKLKRPVLERKNAELAFEASGRSGRDVASCSALVKAYNNVKILDEADFYISYGEKIGVIGGNGTGKSTLVKLLTGAEQPDGGVVNIGSNVKIGYLEQNIIMEDDNRTLLEEFMDKLRLNEYEARVILAKFLFYKDSVFKKVKSLSGGELTRLRLAQLMNSEVNFLILDEPTNHLDIDTREALEDTLEEFDGTVLFISHDRYFINRLADRLYHIENGKLAGYCGNYDYFREKQATVPVQEVKAEKVQKAKPAVLKKPAAAKKEDEDGQLEKRIEELEALMAETRLKMEEPRNASDYMLLQQLDGELEDMEALLNSLYEQWESLLEDSK